MNAAGWAKTVQQVRVLAEVPYLTHLVAGSFTKERREGNVRGTNFLVGIDGTSVNSMGLPNGGIPYLKAHGDEMREIAEKSGKQLVISIAGFSPKEYAELAELVADIGAIAEINAGCPNVHDGGHQKEIISYDFPSLLKTLQFVFEATAGRPTWLKVSPYANPGDRERLADIVRPYEQYVHALVAANTFPNVSVYYQHDHSTKPGRPFIDVANNYAGMAGAALKWINLSQCRHYAELLPNVPCIGVGGISTSVDAADYLLRAKCKGIQIGTAFFENEDTGMFQEIVQHLPEELLTQSSA